jgi:Kdo2-lipid IVA lauroyltransferase/acyltransferase
MQYIGFLIFYLFAIPLSWLPLWVLHRFSDLLFLILYYLIGYRKKVVRQNLQNSFPEKSTIELKRIEKKYYQNLCDWIIETIKLFSISENELKKRMKFVEEEKWNELKKNNRQIVIAAGHYNNFEWGAQRVSLNKSFSVVGLFTELSNKYFNNFIFKNRTRFGAMMIPAKNISNFIEKEMDKSMLHAIGFVADQSPRKESKIYWTTFLNQETAVFTGVERYAKELNALVVFIYPKKIKRGYYEVHVDLICDEPNKTLPFVITETQTRYLENLILQSPESWMWSHKRWKLKRNKND